MTVEDVVRRARLGRMTVYRRFARREDLVEALVVRECRRFLSAVADGIAARRARRGRGRGVRGRHARSSASTR